MPGRNPQTTLQGNDNVRQLGVSILSESGNNLGVGWRIVRYSELQRGRMRWVVTAEVIRNDGTSACVELGAVQRARAAAAHDVGLTLAEAKPVVAKKSICPDIGRLRLVI